MRELFLFNSLSKSKQKFCPIDDGVVRVYTCGPTIYDFAHIGNFRTFVCEDVLIRVLRGLGYTVKHVMNLTDIDDKTIRGCIEANVGLSEFTEKFKCAFFEDVRQLRLALADFYPMATEFVKEMIDMISILHNKGFAYLSSDGSVYFSIKKFERYGMLSGLSNRTVEAGASGRLDIDEYSKDELCDFVLWKKYNPDRDGNVFWDSPWGSGRPGWHIECSAMARSLLGDSIDIHAGGVDNLFPHHENEIAQSECCCSCKFSAFWFHVEHLLVDSSKMAKSSGNFYTLRDLFSRGFDPVHIRFFLLQNHYRSSLNFTKEAISASCNSVNRIRACVVRLNSVSSDSKDEGISVVDEFKDRFWSALSDDINMPVALSVVFDTVKYVNTCIDSGVIGCVAADNFIGLFKNFDSVLQILEENSFDSNLEKQARSLLERRKMLRTDKNWNDADIIREQIEDLGFCVEDYRDYSVIRRK